MQHPTRFTLLSFAVLIVGCAGNAVSEADSEKKGKGVEVRIDALKSTTPGDWKEEPPANKMRYAQFSLPKAKDDKQNGEVVIFKGLGGGAPANIKRWKDMFLPPEGKTI